MCTPRASSTEGNPMRLKLHNPILSITKRRAANPSRNPDRMKTTILIAGAAGVTGYFIYRHFRKPEEI